MKLTSSEGNKSSPAAIYLAQVPDVQIVLRAGSPF